MADVFFALDLSESFIKIVDADKTGNYFDIKSFGFVPSVAHFYQIDTEKVIFDQATKINKLISGLKIKKKNVNLIIPDSVSYSQIIEMPSLNEKELLAAIKYQADQFIPMPLDEVTLDIDILAEDKLSRKVSVLIVAAPKLILSKVEKTIELSGLICQSVENELSATLRFVTNIMPLDPQGKTYLIANALITDNNRNEIYKNCIKTINNYELVLKKKLPKPKKFKPKKQALETDTSKNEFEGIVEIMKSHILRGDIFQVVPSRTIIADYNAEPLDIYQKLRNLNPSPYMFYINQTSGILLGASPEMSLRVEGDKEKMVEIRPIAGTKPRGLVNDEVDADLDSWYETELKIDEKELAEHTMLIDLARNDVAKISKTGTRYCNEPFVVEKYSHVQHLVSNVRGILKEDLDALHAYLATMNMGTLTGCPKVEAMKLIRQHEKNKRGFYGGAIGYITPSGDMDATIVIRSMFLKGNKAYVRAGAGIVYDSIPKNEVLETEKKAKACLNAIKLAGGLK